MTLRPCLKRVMIVFSVGILLLVLGGWLADPGSGQVSFNLIANSGFEDQGTPPAKWYLDPEAARKGTVKLSAKQVRSGKLALCLSPDKNNGGDRPLALGQVLDVSRYRGKRLILSGWVGAEGETIALLCAFLSKKDGGSAGQLVLRKSNTSGELQLATGSLKIPDDIESVILVVGTEGTSGAAYFDDVAFGPEAAAGDVMDRSTTTGPISATVKIDATAVIRTIPRTLYGTNVEWIYDGQLLWDSQRQDLMPQLVDLTRELGVPLIRFPGGGFSDFYHWKQGIGPRDSRPEADHLPGGPKSRHNFGTAEALEFARRVNGQLLITVNASTGTAAEAADWVRHVNGPEAKGPKVTYWEVGNELYMAGAHPGAKNGEAMAAKEYARRFQEFAVAMRKVDPTIRLMAIGGENSGSYSFLADKNWNREVLPVVAAHADLLAVHNAYAPVVVDKNPREDVRTIYAAMLAAPLRVRDSLGRLSAEVKRLAPDRDIKLAVTEWGPLFHPDPGSALVDHVKTLGSGLYAGCVLKEFIEAPSLEVANFFSLNGVGFMGWIGAAEDQLANTPAGKWKYRPTAPYYALQLYTQHFASELISTQVDVETYDGPQVGLVDAIPRVPFLDVVASKSADGQRLTLMAINRNFDRPVRAQLTVVGFTPTGSARQWRLEGTGIDANTGTRLARGIPWAKQIEDQRNPRFSVGSPMEVRVVEDTLPTVGSTFTVEFPRASMTCLELRSKEAGPAVGNAGSKPEPAK